MVVGFKDAEEADRVLLRLAKLKKEHLIDLEGAVVVIRDEAGRVHLKQSINPTINDRRRASCSLPAAYGED